MSDMMAGMPPMMDIPKRNYFMDGKDSVDGLKYRLGAKDIIQDMIDMLRGAVRDQYGRIVNYDENLRLMNDIGIYQAEFFVKGNITKVTHLTNYHSEDRIHMTMRPLARMWSFQITLNRKKWDIKNKDLVQMVVEKTIYESMLRANEGFENNNISKSWYVNENIENNRQLQQQGGMFSKLFNFRGGNNGNY